MTIDELARVIAGHDPDALVPCLGPGVVLVGDGGGHVVAPLRPVRGPAEVARLIGVTTSGSVLHVRSVNGRPAIVAVRAGRPRAVLIVDLVAAQVDRIWLVLNPDKLAGISARPGGES